MKKQMNVKLSFLAIMDQCYQFAAKLDDKRFEEIFCDEGEADQMRQAMLDYFQTYMGNQKNKRTKKFEKVKGTGSPRSLLYLARIGVEFYNQFKNNEEYFMREVGKERYEILIKEYGDFAKKVKDLEKIVEST